MTLFPEERTQAAANSIELPRLFKRAITGAIQVWGIVVDPDGHSSFAGQLGGAITATAKTYVVAKGGRSAAEQALSEAQSKWNAKVKSGYCQNPDEIDNTGIFKAMKPHKYEDFKGKINWVRLMSQPKLDGKRLLADIERGMLSYDHNPIVGVPHVWRAIEPILKAHPTWVLDGELYSHRFRNDFNTLMSRVNKSKPTAEDIAAAEADIQYWIYDICDQRAPGVGFYGRNEWRFKALERDYVSNVLVYVETTVVSSYAHLDELYGDYRARGYEGQIIRNDSPYEQKRSFGLLKRKPQESAEYRIVRFIEGVGQAAGTAASVECALPDGRTFGASVKGSDIQTAELLKNADKYIGTWATIEYQNLTPDGKPRFGQMKEAGREDFDKDDDE